MIKYGHNHTGAAKQGHEADSVEGDEAGDGRAPSSACSGGVIAICKCLREDYIRNVLAVVQVFTIANYVINGRFALCKARKSAHCMVRLEGI